MVERDRARDEGGLPDAARRMPSAGGRGEPDLDSLRGWDEESSAGGAELVPVESSSPWPERWRHLDRGPWNPGYPTVVVVGLLVGAPVTALFWSVGTLIWIPLIVVGVVPGVAVFMRESHWQAFAAIGVVALATSVVLGLMLGMPV